MLAIFKSLQQQLRVFLYFTKLIVMATRDTVVQQQTFLSFVADERRWSYTVRPENRFTWPIRGTNGHIRDAKKS